MPTPQLRLVHDPHPDPEPARAAGAGVPVALTELIGRDGLVHDVIARLREVPLVTLVGTGGIGKTRLALAVADRLAASPSAVHGVRFSDLSTATSDDDVHRAVATALHLVPQPGHALRDSIAVACNAGPLTLVLDNCEQVVEAAASLVTFIRTAAPGTRLLCTSREPLGVSGEVVWQVPPLPLAANGAALHSPAVALFLARARDANASMRVDEASLRDIAALCRALDGVPLAIELAAARTRALTPAQLLARLDDGMRLLRGGPRSAPARHRAMEDAVAWSWAQCSPAEQRCAAAAAQFVGGWTLEAFEVVGGVALEGASDAEADDALAVLTRLVDRSLVLVDDADDGVRYRMLAPVRQYAAAQLARAPWREAVAASHREWYAAYVADAAVRMEHAAHDAWR
ncbi:MAG: hypothetical protein MUE41_17200, partial [Gemmatimonadaceae bacterium]|nr:hypothetical protein [Gemmatimonadaceae bacterium]